MAFNGVPMDFPLGNPLENFGVQEVFSVSGSGSAKEVQTSIQWVKDHKAALEGWDPIESLEVADVRTLSCRETDVHLFVSSNILGPFPSISLL